MSNRLIAEVREENDAVVVNDLTTRNFTSAATLPHLPFLTFEHWHTHRSPSLGVCWYDAGGKQSAVCPERTGTVTLLPGPKARHHNTTTTTEDF